MLLIEIRRIMEETKRTYGVRRVHQALKNRGSDCSGELVENIMPKKDDFDQAYFFRETARNLLSNLPDCRLITRSQHFLLRCLTEKTTDEYIQSI